MKDNEIGVDGAVALSELLKTNTTITTVAFDSLKNDHQLIRVFDCNKL